MPFPPPPAHCIRAVPDPRWRPVVGEARVQDRLEAMPLAALMAEAAALRDAAHGRVISYSRKVFIPLTKLCRDVCHYCTFAEKPRPGHARLSLAGGGAGDRPRRRRRRLHRGAVHPGRQAGTALAPGAGGAGGAGACDDDPYLAAMCALVLKETGLLPHANPGVMTRDEIAALRARDRQPGHHAGSRQRPAVRARAGPPRQRPTSTRRCGWRCCGWPASCACPSPPAS